MDKVNERDLKQKDKHKSGAKPNGKKPIGGEQQKDQKDQWPPSSGPGERSDQDAIGRPVQLDKD